MNALAVLYGMFLWALVILQLFLFGPALLDGGWKTLILFAATIPIVWALLNIYWKVTLTLPDDRPRGAALVCLPGLFLNAVFLLMEPQIFSWPGDAIRAYGAWSLWVCGWALAMGVRAITRPADRARSRPNK